MAGNDGVRDISLARIMRSRWQPRDETFDAEELWGLACSIQENGLINPVVVFPVTIAEDDPEPWYELVAGERRSRALAGLALGQALNNHTPKEYVERLAVVSLAGLGTEERRVLEESGATIRAQVEPADDLERLHCVAVVENLERASLSPLEEARALAGLMEEHGWSQRELARRIGRSQSYVAQSVVLLGLADEAKEAVSTRVLTTTHARAIARVPEPLQPVVTEWATGAVSQDDSPATTRQVQNRARQLAAFVDPVRWMPNAEHVYMPIERNRLRLLGWAVERCDVGEQGEALMNLADYGWSNTNLLAKKPSDLVANGSLFIEVLEALGWGDQRQAWCEFNQEWSRSCATCVMGDVEMTPGEEIGVYCSRLRTGDLNEGETCSTWIGGNDPVIITIPTELARVMNTSELEFEAKPFYYMTTVRDYVESYALALAAERERIAKNEQGKAQKHILAIRRFFEWQLELGEALEHFQSHDCLKCVNCQPEALTPGAPTCRFEDGTLTDWSGPRAPEFGVLVREDGLMLPRCEHFEYSGPELPQLHRYANVNFPWEVAVRWLRGIGTGGSGASSNQSVCWGILRWAPYNHPDKGATDWDRLCRWIRDGWEDLGGAGGVAVLLDVALSERRLREARKQPFMLLNAQTGEEERFGAEGFTVVIGERDYGWSSCPEEWPKPWEASDE